MKASFHSKYGSPDVLEVREVDKPLHGEHDVLIKVHATTVNRTDLGMLRGMPWIIRLFTGVFKPALTITGTDFAGVVEAVGKCVTSFKAGDRVMGFGGMGLGTHAEFVALPDTRAILIIPEKQSYEEAVASLEGAFYALRCIESVKPGAGQKALVNGTTGAIGSAVVQFLKYYGLHVTAVCGTENVELVKSLGADRIIDYRKEDFTKDSDRYSFVFDAVGKSSFARCKPLLNANGTYTSTDGFENLFLAMITPLLGGRKVVFRPPANIRQGLAFIKARVEDGSFRPLIDRKYPLDRIVEAFQFVASGQKVGNVIIIMDN